MGDKHINNKLPYLEMLRCVALVLVVLLHVVAIPIQNWNRNLDGEYVVYSISYAVGNCGVPLFLMISGTLLLAPEKNISIAKIYRQMMPRILLPLCILGVIFACMEIFFETNRLSIGMIFEAMLRVVNRKSWGHLWYLYMLLGIYMFLPVLKHLVNSLSEERYVYFTIILIILGYVFPTTNAVLGTNISVNAPLPLCHITSFWIGYAVVRYEKRKKLNTLVYIFGVISIIILITSGAICNRFGYNGYGIMAQYNNIFVLGSTVLIYKITKLMVIKINFFFESLATCSFGIYLFHPVVMNVLYKVVNIQPVNYSPISILFFALAFILPSWIAVIIMKRVPVIKKFV